MNIQLKLKILEKFETQADGAMRLGVHESVLSRVVRGRRQLPEAERRRWAKVLGCEVTDIFPVQERMRGASRV